MVTMIAYRLERERGFVPTAMSATAVQRGERLCNVIAPPEQQLRVLHSYARVLVMAPANDSNITPPQVA